LAIDGGKAGLPSDSYLPLADFIAANSSLGDEFFLSLSMLGI
jgi:hypothetical protein